MEDEKVTVMLDRVAEGKIFCPYDDIALMKPCLHLKSCSFWYFRYISKKRARIQIMSLFCELCILQVGLHNS